MEQLAFDTQILEGKSIIQVSADLDNENAGEALRVAFNKLYERGHRTVILDLDQVEIINSYGLGKILQCHRKLIEADGVLMMKPTKGFVREVLEMLMLSSLFPEYSEEPESPEKNLDTESDQTSEEANAAET